MPAYYLADYRPSTPWSDPTTWTDEQGNPVSDYPRENYDQAYLCKYGDSYWDADQSVSIDVDVDVFGVCLIPGPFDYNYRCHTNNVVLTATNSTSSQRRLIDFSYSYGGSITFQGTPYQLNDVSIGDEMSNAASLYGFGDVYINGNVTIRQGMSGYENNNPGNGNLNLGAGGILAMAPGTSITIHSHTDYDYSDQIYHGCFSPGFSCNLGQTASPVMLYVYMRGVTIFGYIQAPYSPYSGFYLSGTPQTQVHLNVIIDSGYDGYDWNGLFWYGTGLFVQIPNNIQLMSFYYKNSGSSDGRLPGPENSVSLGSVAGIVTNDGSIIYMLGGTPSNPVTFGSYRGMSNANLAYIGNMTSRGVIKGDVTLDSNFYNLIYANYPDVFFVEGLFKISGAANWYNVRFDYSKAIIKDEDFRNLIPSNVAKDVKIPAGPNAVTGSLIVRGVSTDPGKANVIDGVNYIIDDVPITGEHPTAAASKAQQLAEDKDAVYALRQYIIRPADDGMPILTIDGTFDLSMDREAAAAVQFIIDQVEVREKSSSIIAPDRGGQLILGIPGTAQAITSGGGSVIVNHNFGGTDALRVFDAASMPVEGVAILAYIASDYAMGFRRAIAAAFTASDGRWLQDMKLNPNTYTLTFESPGKVLYARNVMVKE